MARVFWECGQSSEMLASLSKLCRGVAGWPTAILEDLKSLGSLLDTSKARPDRELSLNRMMEMKEDASYTGVLSALLASPMWESISDVLSSVASQAQDRCPPRALGGSPVDSELHPPLESALSRHASPQSLRTSLCSETALWNA
eukprot:8189871-Alexandrium_andersonii.AAC.1